MKRSPTVSFRYSAILLLLGAGLGAACFGRSIDLDAPPFSRDETLLEKAWSLPTAQIWKTHPLDYQIYEGYCGVATSVNIAHSLDRGYANQKTALDGFSLGEWDVRTSGMTLDELASLLRMQTERNAEVVRSETLDEFKRELRKSNDPAYRYAINFHRKPLFGGGWGHHSPLAGYLEKENLALVLDVSHNYGPYLVDADQLFESIRMVDSSTGKQRGLIRIQAGG